jgi:hypothetical protein
MHNTNKTQSATADWYRIHIPKSLAKRVIALEGNSNLPNLSSLDILYLALLAGIEKLEGGSK